MNEEKQHYIDLPNGDIFKLLLENKIKPGTKIIYDGRFRSFNLLERFFSDNFYYISVPPRGDDFFGIERKDNEICCKDSFFEGVKTQTTYFKDNEQK